MKVRKPPTWPSSVQAIRMMPRTDRAFCFCLKMLTNPPITLTEPERKYYTAILQHQAGEALKGTA